MSKSRKVRSDILVGNLEKKLGLEPGAIRNPDGSDARSNKKLATLRKEYSQAKGSIKTNPSISSKSIARASKAVSALSNMGAKTINRIPPAKTNTSRISPAVTVKTTSKATPKKAVEVNKSTTKKNTVKAKSKKIASKKG